MAEAATAAEAIYSLRETPNGVNTPVRNKHHH